VAKNISKKELKQPDQFVSFWTRFSTEAGRVLAARRRPVLIGLGVLTCVVVATIIYAQVRERAGARASEALARVDKVATADLLPAEGAAKESPAMAGDESVPRFKTEKERSAAALKGVDDFLASNGHGPLRAEAQLKRAGLLLDLGRADEAIPAYEEVLSSDLSGNMRFLAQEGLGYAYEAKGDLDKALAAFTALGAPPVKKGEAGEALGFYQDRSLYHQGRLAERKGNPAEAARLYKEVLDKQPTTPLREEISSRLAVLETK
jgi:tetratricopeptide (TPR) repeat protein